MQFKKIIIYVDEYVCYAVRSACGKAGNNQNIFVYILWSRLWLPFTNIIISVIIVIPNLGAVGQVNIILMASMAEKSVYYCARKPSFYLSILSVPILRNLTILFSICTCEVHLYQKIFIIMKYCFIWWQCANSIHTIYVLFAYVCRYSMYVMPPWFGRMDSTICMGERWKNYAFLAVKWPKIFTH